MFNFARVYTSWVAEQNCVYAYKLLSQSSYVTDLQTYSDSQLLVLNLAPRSSEIKIEPSAGVLDSLFS